MGVDPATCTEEVSPSYTIGTFRLFVQKEGATGETEIGDIQTGGFQFTPTVVEHRRGIDNSLDWLLKNGSDYIINATGDELTVFNVQTLLNEDTVPVSGGCRIPFTGGRCVPSYYVRLEHDFPCLAKSINVVFWRAQILADTTITFDRTTPSSFPIVIRSLHCGTHPSNPFGYWFQSESCPPS